MTHDLVPVENVSVGQVANQVAKRHVFPDYLDRKAAQTLRRQKGDLTLFSEYLALVNISTSPDALQNDPLSWSPVTYGLVKGFLRWQVQEGYAIGSINIRLSTVKCYCGLAAEAGVLDTSELAMIRLVKGYTHKEGRNVDAQRETTRVGEKKADSIQIDVKDAAKLKARPDTDQGRRDMLLVCLLLDHGLRCGEIAQLPINAINLDTGILTFYREKVDKMQTHELTRDTWIAARRYFEIAKPEKFLLMGSRKGGTLQGRMSDRAITARMKKLCSDIGIEGASAHDGRHAWATYAVKGGTDIKSLQDAGGWSSPAMPLRYVDSSKIANRGVKLITAEEREG